MRSILIDHNHRYPGWEMDDLYKLIHQAAMGSEHALTDESGVRAWLRNELAHPGPGMDEPLIDPISADGRIVRVHLRPFTTRHLQEEPLLQAFIRTARVVIPSKERLAEYAGSAIQLAQEGLLPFEASRLAGYFSRMREAGYPAAAHSVRYERLYQPAYRVVARDLLPGEVKDSA